MRTMMRAMQRLMQQQMKPANLKWGLLPKLLLLLLLLRGRGGVHFG